MELITKEQVRASVAERWKNQYCVNGRWEWTFSGDADQKYAKLKALPDDASDADFEDVIGNRSWTNLFCDECQLDVQSVVSVGHGDRLCYDCLQKATNMMMEPVHD